MRLVLTENIKENMELAKAIYENERILLNRGVKDLYKYKESKDGEILPVPVDKNNHIIDGVRYAAEELGNKADLSPRKNKPAGF